MGRTPLSLLRLSRFLRRRGHRPERLAYFAAGESFDRIRARVRRRLEAMAVTGEPYSALGHSLGGVVLRAALPGLEPGPEHLIFLGTPNRPPRLASRLRRFLLYRILCGESGQLLGSLEFYRQLPVPAVPYTIVAGSAGPRGRWSPFGEDANDCLVAVDETKIRPDDRPIVLNVGHTFMMNDERVQAVIGQILQR